MSTIPIIAEVLVKEPSIITIWVLFGSIALIGFGLCCYWRWWPAPGFLIVAMLLGLALFDEFSSVGLLTSGESPSYVAQFYVAVACAVLLPVIGAMINFSRTHHP
ncbi:MAG TPA: hypothetical protein VK747_24015 [Blastocatellia bacterium]|nr:hypothetical protein [Blastocatellia bacterium]